MLTALVSLLRGTMVANDIAMTGEITLRGLVMPVGGIKEKVLAAKRAGIEKVILPEKNKNDLEDVPKHIRKSMTFHFVKEMDEVVEKAILPDQDGKIAAKRARKRIPRLAEAEPQPELN